MARNLPPVSARGEARCPGPSTAEIIRGDGDNAPAVITEQSYRFLGDGDVSYDAYTAPEFAAREVARMWPRVWQFACRDEHLPQPRDSYVHDLGPYSVLLVRQGDMTVRAFVNSCKHRGMQLQAGGTRASLPVIRCPFHGWSWNPNGELLAIPCAWDFPHASKADFALDRVRVDSWGGFIFVNLDGQAPPLDQYLGVIPRHFAQWPIARRHIRLHIRKRVPANWKLALEAFLEAYHVMATHPQGLPTAGDANCQYDVFGENVSRFVHTVGFPSPHLGARRSQEQILSALGGGELGLKLDQRGNARAVFADFRRSTLGAQMGVDLSAYSISEMLDSIEYYCFPNLVVFPGIGFQMVYRFRPDGDNVESSLFDLFMMTLTPDGEDAPPAPLPVELDYHDSFTSVAGMEPMLGQIYDQDTDNLERLAKGVRASRKPGQTLGNYQEVRIRHMRQTLARYVEEPVRRP